MDAIQTTAEQMAVSVAELRTNPTALWVLNKTLVRGSHIVRENDVHNQDRIRSAIQRLRQLRVLDEDDTDPDRASLGALGRKAYQATKTRD